MNYKVLYEIGTSKMNFLTWFLPVIFFVAFIIVLLIKVNMREFKRIKIGLLVVFAIMWMSFFSDTLEYYKNKRVYQSNQCDVVEGEVAFFRKKGTAYGETLEMGDKQFYYAQAELNGQLYYSVASDVHGGSYVRIYYKPGTTYILKLEVRE